MSSDVSARGDDETVARLLDGIERLTRERAWPWMQPGAAPSAELGPGGRVRWVNGATGEPVAPPGGTEY